MGEHVNQQRFRTRVRGTAHSFEMPWEDIVRELRKQSDKAAALLEELPRKPEQLQYVLRVLLRVQHRDMDRVLRRLTVRPYVLLKLLEYLIDHNHMVFRGRGVPRDLKSQVAAAVAKWYPLDAGQEELPEEQRTCDVSQYVVDVEATAGADIGESSRASKKARPTLLKEKSSTPGAGFTSANNVFEDNRETLVGSRNPGWFFRVVREASVQPGKPSLISRPGFERVNLSSIGFDWVASDEVTYDWVRLMRLGKRFHRMY